MLKPTGGVCFRKMRFFSQGKNLYLATFPHETKFQNRYTFLHETNHLNFTPHNNKNKIKIIAIGANNIITPYLNKAIIKANTKIIPPKKLKLFIFTPPFLFIL